SGQRPGGGRAGPVVPAGRAPHVGQAVGAGLERRPDRRESPGRVVGDELGEAVLAVLPGVGQLMEGDVAQPGRVVERRGPDPDHRLRRLVHAPVATVGRIEGEIEADAGGGGGGAGGCSGALVDGADGAGAVVVVVSGGAVVVVVSGGAVVVVVGAGLAGTGRSSTAAPPPGAGPAARPCAGWTATRPTTPNVTAKPVAPSCRARPRRSATARRTVPRFMLSDAPNHRCPAAAARSGRTWTYGLHRPDPASA